MEYRIRDTCIIKFISQNTCGILQGLPLKLKMIKKVTQEHGTIDIVTIVLDGVEMLKLRELANSERASRASLSFDIKLIEDKAKSDGFLKPTDTDEDVQAEFYTRRPVVIQQAEKGTSPDALVNKLSEENQPEQPEQKVKSVQPEKKIVDSNSESDDENTLDIF